MNAIRAAFLAHTPAAPLPPRPRRWPALALAGAALAAWLAGVALLDISPGRIAAGVRRLGDIFSLMLPPSPGGSERFWTYLGALGETLAIAFLGTALASVFALPLGFLAARNVVANRVVHFLARRALDTARSIDTLIWALIWVNVVGLGPFAGALAIASTDVAALAKLMSEAIETVSQGPVEGVKAAGGGRIVTLRFGVVPQVLPVFLSQLLYFFESNTRSATIIGIGIVGAGGVGLYMSEAIRVLEWGEVAFLILMILVAVAVIDAISRRLRAAIQGPWPRRS